MPDTTEINVTTTSTPVLVEVTVEQRGPTLVEVPEARPSLEAVTLANIQAYYDLPAWQQLDPRKFYVIPKIQ